MIGSCSAREKTGASVKERHFTLNMKIYMYVWCEIFFSYDDF